MPVLKWLKIVTSGLFATHERPIFLLLDENSQDFASAICKFIAFLGGDVVRLCEKDSVSSKDYLFYDGVFTVSSTKKHVALVFKRQKGQKKKIYRKIFPIRYFAV